MKNIWSSDGCVLFEQNIRILPYRIFLDIACIDVKQYCKTLPWIKKVLLPEMMLWYLAVVYSEILILF